MSSQERNTGERFVEAFRRNAEHLQASHLYDPSEEHDACGVGFVAAIDGCEDSAAASMRPRPTPTITPGATAPTEAADTALAVRSRSNSAARSTHLYSGSMAQQIALT